MAAPGSCILQRAGEGDRVRGGSSTCIGSRVREALRGCQGCQGCQEGRGALSSSLGRSGSLLCRVLVGLQEDRLSRLLCRWLHQGAAVGAHVDSTRIITEPLIH